MHALDTLCHISIMVNSGILYFTSKTFREIFTGTSDGKTRFVKWELVTFLVLVISVEHLMLILKMLLDNIISDHPTYIKEGEHERDKITQLHRR